MLDLFASSLPAKPYCTDDLACGLKIRPKATAEKCRYIQPNTPTTLAWFVFDVDHADAAIRWDDAGLPPPTLTVVNLENGHAHLLYTIKTPVFCTPDHQKPLRLAAAIQEAYRQKLDADPGYSGLICKNPLNPHWRVLAHSGAVYDLGYLSEWVDISTAKKSPQEAHATGLGRNCTMFDGLRMWAYQWIAVYRDTATTREWDAVVLAQAEKLNTFATPLHTSEVRAIAKSTAKWCWNKFDIQASNERFSKLQAHRGKKSGMARLAKTQDKRVRARLMQEKGMTQAAISAELGVHVNTVANWLKANPQ
jgi:hypothetical protein